MAPQRTGVAERQTRVPQLLALQRRGDVALAVAGSDQHQRDDVDAAVAGLDEALHGDLDRRRRQLQEAAGDVGVRRTQLYPLDELPELLAAALALGAVADDKQGGSHGVSSEVGPSGRTSASARSSLL